MFMTPPGFMVREAGIAAAEELSSQAAQLRQMLSRFRLKQHATSWSGVAAPAAPAIDWQQVAGKQMNGSGKLESTDLARPTPAVVIALDASESGKY
jgi:methyl-accepting chemotaxis protein